KLVNDLTSLFNTAEAQAKALAEGRVKLQKERDDLSLQQPDLTLEATTKVSKEASEAAAW
ncbi:MAG: hypothetical protein M1358_12330, partial [Chloroflexi bacterium]|nr:hypothetical protein [Chloroflexota bacterium]